jgi:hypothetical protein
MLRDVMTKAGNRPAYLMATKQSHMSEIIGLNSDDKEVEGPVYAWLKRTL